MNAFSQNEFKGAYHATKLKQLRLLADHGDAEAREFLGVVYANDQFSGVSTPAQFNLFARLAERFWTYTESSYEAWVTAGRPCIGIWTEFLDQIFYLPV